MNVTYLITPFASWFVTGIIKFMVNCARERRCAIDLVGYGGMPSNHASIMSSMTALIGFREGIDHPAFGASLAATFIVLLDAVSLRRKLGKHATYLNELMAKADNPQRLRTRLGHSPQEVAAGIALGVLLGAAFSRLPW